MIRLFVGLPLPVTVKERFASLASGIPQAHWTPPANLHVTLRFIGEVDELQAELIHDCLLGIRCPAFDATLTGCGTFDSGHRAHTLWVGVERSPELMHLHEKVESAVVRAGLEPEGRKYTPHVTLARLRNAPLPRVQTYVAGNNLLRDEFRVECFTLFSSRLGHGDPVYTAEAEYGLELSL